jgi:hypothetical protein
MKRMLLAGMLALVPVVVSGQTPVRVVGQRGMTATTSTTSITTNGDAVCFNVDSSMPAAVLTITGTWTGTISPRARNAAGTLVTPPSGDVSATSTTSNAAIKITNSGYTALCLSATAAMTGTAVVSAVAGGAGAAGSGSSGGVVTGANTPSDNFANPTDAVPVQGFTMFWDGATWDRWNGNVGASATGTFANDANAAGTNRVTTLPGITENAAPSRTDGRNAALSLTTGGAARVMITNSAGAATTIATDNVFGTATYTEATTTGPLVGAVRTDTPAALANTTNEIAPLASSALGGLYVASASDPCSRLAKTVIVINIASATTTELTPSLAGASNNYYVCSLTLVAAATQAFALTDDDSDNCGSVTSGMAGGTTAATGFNFAANGGMTFGNGMGTIFKTNGTNRVICGVTSTTGQLSGTMTVVAAP